MAISLKSILDNAENSGQNPDGSPFDQRSLGYGDNPPLVIKDLPGVNKETNGALDLIGQVTDNFVRGGAIALGNAVIDDLKRLGKVLISPNGLAWSAAQFALSKTNPESLLSPRNRQTLPVSTLLTVGTGAAGVRFRKDGLIDIKTESGFNYDSTRGGPKYESSLLELSTLDIDDTSDHTIRGTHFYINGGGFEGREDLIKSYKGGAHSTFGIGNTEIKRYKSTPYGLNSGNKVNKDGYLPLFNQNFFELRQGPNKSKLTSGTAKYVDYRTARGLPTPVKSTRIGLYKMGDPGIKINDGEGYGAYNSRTVDQISAANIFKRQDLESFEGEFKDYIKFRIAVVDTDNPLNDNVILFRALLDNVADNFSGEWNSYKYNGRAEKFYTYGGFDRTIDFGFKIHTQTRWEQKPLWRKLNYLVAQTAPEYKNRRMRGVFSRLTIGDWMNEIPGFFTSVNLGWNTAYPWEIRYDSEGADKDLNEYPHILDVACSFQPVHNFAPSNSPTTPFILPEIGVNGNRRYARQSDDENANQFTDGVALNAENAYYDSDNIAADAQAVHEALLLEEAKADPLANQQSPQGINIDNLELSDIASIELEEEEEIFD
jgi:hypothetical protein